MFHDPFHWFPNAIVSNLFAALVLGLFLLDAALQRRGARQRKGPALQRADAGSLVVVNGSLVLSLLIAAGCRYLGLGITTGWAQNVGLTGMALGFMLREWSVLTLGPFFSNVVAVEQGHQLITAGPYKWLRHPSYTGLLLFFAAAALALGSWLGVALTFALIFLALRYRIRIEERMMAQTFAGAYQAYADQTWRLFPGW